MEPTETPASTLPPGDAPQLEGAAAPEEVVAPAETPAAARKRALLGLLAATVIGATAVGLARWAEGRGGSVATVEGIRVPRAAYVEIFDRARTRYGKRFSVDFGSPAGQQVEADLRTSVVRELVDRELIRQEAERRGVVLPVGAAEAEITRARKTYPKPEMFEQMLAEQGGTVEGLRTQIESGLRAEALAAAIGGASEPSAPEVRAYFDANRAMYRRPEEVHARHILVKDEALARRLADELAVGGNFATLAGEHSTDPGSGSRGGDLGFFGRGRMVKPFEEAAFALKPGQLSKPVKSQFGWHLIKVEERRAERAVGFEEVRAEITRRLADQRRKAAFEAWLAQRRKAAAITYAEGFAPAGGAGDGHGGH